MDSVPAGLLLIDLDSNIVASNAAAESILGFDAVTLQSMNLHDPRWHVIHPDGRPWPSTGFPVSKALHGGPSETDVPMGLIDKDGRLRWLVVSTSHSSELGASGRRGAVAVITDITHHHLAVERITEFDHRFELMVDSVLDYAIFMLDVRGHVSSWNRGAQRMKGYTAEEIIGQHISRFYPADDVRKPEDELAQATANGRCEDTGWRVRKDGSRFWGHVVISAIRNADGILVGFAKVTHDLSERRRIEAALAETHRRMQSMIDGSPFGIVATDTAGLIRNVNPAAERMFGYVREELIGLAGMDLYLDPAEIAARASALSLETGETIVPGFDALVFKSRRGITEEGDWTCIRKDGSRFPVRSTLTSLHDPDGTLTGYMGVAYDITERKRRDDHNEHIAYHDHLTGLPTRSLMDDRLTMAMQRARREGGKVGLLMIDLDLFKRINHTLGHHVGDQLLIAVAHRLRACVRATDTVARLGGDEFVVVLPGIEAIRVAQEMAAKIVREISATIELGAHQLNVTPSIGIAIFPDDHEDATTLLRRADAAMYVAKTAGGGCYRRFIPGPLTGQDAKLLPAPQP